MLDAMRKRAGSWIVKGLLGLLILAFAIWGIGDYMVGGGEQPPVARVGGTEIRQQELSDAFRDHLARLEQQLGQRIDREQAIAMGLMEQALQDLVARRLLDLGAAELRLTVPDETLRREIVENPAFRGETGFDRRRFEALLLRAGLSEDGYIAMLRQEMLRAHLIDSIAGTVEVPEALARAIYAHRNEERAGRALVVERARITDIPEPSEEDLLAFLEEQEERYTAPEYRGLTVVTLRPEDMLDEIAIAEDELRAVYEERRGDYLRPERRVVEQLLASDEAAIEEARARVAAGENLEEVAEGLDLVFDRLEDVEEGDLPPAFADSVFALSEGEVGEPIESAFGLHLFRVVAIEPETVTPFEEVRERLHDELARFEAANRLPALANALDDELAAGLGLEEAAESVGLEPVRIEAVDSGGRTPEGAPMEAVPAWEELLEIAFNNPAGDISLLHDSPDGGYFVLRVDRVVPPRLRDLEEVREDVERAWREQYRDRRARELAEELAGRAREVAALEALAEQHGAVLRSFEGITRQGTGGGAGLSRAAVQAAFQTPEAGIAAQPVPVQGGYAVLAVDRVEPADPDADPEGVARLRAQLAAEMQDDLLAQFEAALRQSFPVEIDSRALRGLL